jgi:hypothetical protein
MRDPFGGVAITDADLETALRDLGGSLAIPAGAHETGALDPARRARIRIEQAPAARATPLLAGWIGRGGDWIRGGRLRRGLVLALVAVIVVAAIAGAIGLGLPGIRIVTAPSASAGPTGAAPNGSPQASASAPSASLTVAGPAGSGMGLGNPIAVADASTAAGIPLRLPTAAGVGAPVTAWILDGRLSLVWTTNRALPSTREPGIGLILSEFRGSLQPEYFQKVITPDTTITPVTVDGVTGYWISGAPHEVVFVDEHGQPIFDTRRIVGDTLLWARGDVTYRLESGLDRAGAIALAATLR